MLGGRLSFLKGATNPVGAGFVRESELAPSPAAPAQNNGVLRRAPRRHVLMLDIDGVLHPAQAGSLIYMPVLEAWLRSNVAVDVVISSNWKDTHTLEQLRAFFGVDLRERVLGATPNLPGHRREDEILALVEQHDIEQRHRCNAT